MIIGITGPIASGKDEVVNFLIEKFNLNYSSNFSNTISKIIDADKVGKFIVENSFTKISSIFNVKNIAEISNLVFSDFLIFSKYNSLIHPILSSKLREILINQKIRIEKTDQKSKNKKENHKFDDIILINCALLFLFRLEFFCDKIIFIDSKRELRIDRLIKRNNISINEAERRVDFQEKIENYEKIRMNFITKMNINIKSIDVSKNINGSKKNTKIYYLRNDENLKNLIDTLKEIFNSYFY
ncbi:MAG: dephospho-CoA kinase [Exilispira sp.]|jgi:dephospho-CoA kinase|nr:dephospho-CoA kinase [Exilispira sp.]